MTRNLHLNSRLLPAVFALLIILQLIAPYRGWMILLFGLGGAWLFSYLWARSLYHHLIVTREIRFGWAQVGDQLEERFTIDNAGWAPALWVETIDHSTLPGPQFNWATEVGARNFTQWHTSRACMQRGVWVLGPTSLKSGDPFGFFTIEIHDRRSQSVMVMPPIVPLPSIDIAPGGRSGEGYPRPNAMERTISAGSVREYTPGDSLHWIHWKSTAHHNHPFVRIFDGTPAGDWLIILDLDKNTQLGEGSNSTAEHAIILAASLAARGLSLRRAVGLAASSHDTAWIPPLTGEGQRWEILRTLAAVKVGDYPIASFLRSLEHEIHSQTSLILITPSIQSSLVDGLLHLIWRRVIPTIILLDPLTFGGIHGTQSIQEALTDLGIAHYIISRDVLNQPEAHPGQEGRWGWRVTPSGRAVLVHKPGDLSWKALT